ncbi:MAG TPA: Fe-Mn family superoxide dismutase [Reyranellaceae bacterium]|nr:Fe-Mn family superoxide dismutase [Reyranellaceae bacterium]
MVFVVKPISFKPGRLKGLSPKLTASHYENNYGGAVRRLNVISDELAALDPGTAPGFRLNGLKREQLIATNSMLLHEVFFDSLGEGGGGDPDGDLAEAIARDFGSIAKWRTEFVAMGKALGGGSGWVLLTRSPRDGSLMNVWCADHTHSLAGGTPLLALDMYEHSYHIDFGANPAAYVDAFMNNIAWRQIAARFAGQPASPKTYAVDHATAKAMLEADPNLLVIDARLADDALMMPTKLRGARRAPPGRVDEVVKSLPKGGKALVYCAWGFDIGGDCAAKLRAHGIDAVTLQGGIGAWRADGLPTEPHKEGESA